MTTSIRIATLSAMLVATGAFADEKQRDGILGPAQEFGGILSSPSFADFEQDEIYTAGGQHPHVYARGAVSLVFPFDVDVERDSGTSDDLELSSKLGFGYNAGVGFRLGPGPNPSDPGIGYRFEGEFAQRFYDTDAIIDSDGNTVEDVDGDIEVTTIMGNFLIDITNEGYRGYIGFGAGFAMIDAEIDGDTDDDTSIALQIPIGVEMRIVDNVWVDFGTRWMYIPGLDIDTDITEFSVLTADLYVGLLVEF
jgi:opacity protein-like surface antigen